MSTPGAPPGDRGGENGRVDGAGNADSGKRGDANGMRNHMDVRAHVVKQWRLRELREEAILRAAEEVIEKRKSQSHTAVSGSLRGIADGGSGLLASGSVRLLPKFAEPERAMCHWDHVIAEAMWVRKVPSENTFLFISKCFCPKEKKQKTSL